MESKGRGRERVKGKELAFLKAFLESPNMTVACKKAGISRKTGYRYLESEEFKRVLEESQQEALKDTIRYLQGNLDKCNLTLMKIIASADSAPQVKIKRHKHCLLCHWKDIGELGGNGKAGGAGASFGG